MVVLDPQGRFVRQRGVCSSCPHRHNLEDDHEGESTVGFCPGDLGDAIEGGTSCPLLTGAMLARDLFPDAPDGFLAEPEDFLPEQEEVEAPVMAV